MIKRMLSLGLFLLLIFCNVGISFECIPKNAFLLKGISTEIQIDVTFGEVLNHVETHGGFLGDGETYVEISFTEEEMPSLTEEICSSSNWKELPASNVLSAVLYGGQVGETDHGSFVENKDLGIPALPIIEYGFYFFRNDNYAASGSDDETSIFDSYSYNFTIALLDLDRNRIIYFDFDT